MKNLKKDLQAISKELQILADKTERWLKILDKYEKPKAKTLQAKAVKRTPAKNVAVKNDAPETAVNTVHAIIKRYKKGVGTEALMEKTGYNPKKISNLVYKLKKQGKIKRVRKGVYVKA